MYRCISCGFYTDKMSGTCEECSLGKSKQTYTLDLWEDGEYNEFIKELNGRK